MTEPQYQGTKLYMKFRLFKEGDTPEHKAHKVQYFEKIRTKKMPRGPWGRIYRFFVPSSRPPCRCVTGDVIENFEILNMQLSNDPDVPVMVSAISNEVSNKGYA